MEMSNIVSYFALKSFGVVTLTNDENVIEMRFKRFSTDTGEEMTNAMSHVPVSVDELNGMKTDYQSKIDLIDDFIAEINAL
jgi:hypothetical protein